MTSAQQGAPAQSPPKSRFEHVVETLATGLGGSIGWLAERGVLFIVFAAMWLSIGAMLMFSPGSVESMWQTIGTLPLVVQLVAWLLFLPVMAGLWVWATTWPVLAKLGVMLALAVWTLLIFRPKWLRLPGSAASTSNQS
jgi:hypothetical protein